MDSSAGSSIPPGLVPIVPYSALALRQGALLIGVMVSLVLFGVSTMQTWYYFMHYPRDQKYLKMTVALLWIFEVWHAVLGFHKIYWYFVLNYSNPTALGVSVWSANAFITLIVHVFFAWRVKVLSQGRLIMPSIIIFCALASSGFVFGTVGLSFKAGTFAKYPDSITAISSTSLALAVFTDIMIAGSISFYLHRGRSGLIKTDHLINKLIFWSLNVGVLTSVLDFVVLITSEVEPDLIFLAVFDVVGSVYANSLLATLNIRAITRDQVLNEDGTSLELQSTSFNTTFAIGASQSGGLGIASKKSRSTMGIKNASRATVHNGTEGTDQDFNGEESIFEAAPATEFYKAPTQKDEET